MLVDCKSKNDAIAKQWTIIPEVKFSIISISWQADFILLYVYKRNENEEVSSMRGQVPSDLSARSWKNKFTVRGGNVMNYSAYVRGSAHAHLDVPLISRIPFRILL